MEKAAELDYYLPLSFKTPSEQIRQARPEDLAKGLIGFARVDEIQTHSEPVIEDCYREFLLHSHDPEEREYFAADQIREALIHDNYLSQKDLDICRSFDLASLDDEAPSKQVRELHNAWIAKYRTDDESSAA